ncbi:MAG: prepilin-type N-terminal cleavage/methylation domain-containing protein [Elusimicrobia bacterium]|nr:prepilin-type N-terminal cleavage/methylation domain-containing protein [Elusimicrobiota bacterium]
MRERAAGFTLIELVVAMALASLVIVGLNSLMLPLVRAQVSATRTQSTQSGLTGALSAVERALRTSSVVTAPAMPGFPSDRLEGCANAVPEGAAFVAADPGRPTRWFAMCAREGALYYHQGGGCPARYVCGRDAAAEFGGGVVRGASAAFTRPSRWSPVVDVELSFASGDVSSSARTAVAVGAAAGSNQ